MLSDGMSQGLRHSGMLQSTDSKLVTDVSGDTVGPIFKSQSQEDTVVLGMLDP